MKKNRFYLQNKSYPKLDNYSIKISESEKLEILVDIGSCKGDFMNKYRNNFAECFAFEASYENAALINNRIYSENWDNCAVFNLAVSDTTGEIITLMGADSADAGSNSIIGGSTHNSKKQNVYSIKFDDIFTFLGIEQIDLLKMDCEGCEYKALENADLSKVKIICMELHCWEGIEDKKQTLAKKILETHYDVNQDKYSLDLPAPDLFGNSHSVCTFIRRDL